MDQRLQHVLDVAEIKDLLVRERYYRDIQDWDGLRSSWHPEAGKTKIDISWFNGNIDGFVSGSREMARRGLFGKHEISPRLVQFNAGHDKAVAESTGSLRMPLVFEEVRYEVIAYVRFISELEKYGAQWYVTTFEAIYESDMLLPVFPTNAAAPMPPNAGFRKSYATACWALEQAGFPTNPSLPGTDQPSTVTRMMERHLSWLHESPPARL